jgi:membrane-bound lytic murein transglycosylase D
MRKSQSWLPILSLLAILTVSCGSREKQRATVAPPMRASAPTIGQPEPAPAPQIQEKVIPKADPVEDLLAQVEKEYQAGQANYAAGHLEAAKANFDRAVDLLMQGPVEVRSDERLQAEFDKVIEGVHNLEMLALKEGDGFTQQEPEPAPIDEAADVTFPVDPAVKAKAEEEVKRTRSDLPLVLNDEVASFISYFSNRGRGTVERALTRSARYRDMILRILKEEGVPQDLIYLAQAESGFHALALSRAGARGMWQFMASRGTMYGLDRNWWVDERQDPEKATRAAARHLKDLHNQFGDWYLAMAAYNSGPGTVQSAVQRTGYADFWQLYRRGVLPRETRNYVPIIIAVTIMNKNPEKYGLDDILLDPPSPMDRVTVNYPVDLRLVAECVDASVNTLQELNPSLLRMTTPKEGEFELRLPGGTKEKFLTNIKAIPLDKRVWWRYHRVMPGDTLSAIARKYKTTTVAITEVNDLGSDEVKSDSKLIIPVTPGRGAGAALGYSRKVTRYKVRKGDTVLSVADDFGVPPELLRKWNRLKGNQLRRGRTLLIRRPVAPDSVAAMEGAGKVLRASAKSSKKASLQGNSGTRMHTVRPGDTLFSIALAYNTTVAALQRDNRSASTTIRPGDVLVIKSGR